MASNSLCLLPFPSSRTPPFSDAYSRSSLLTPDHSRCLFRSPERRSAAAHGRRNSHCAAPLLLQSFCLDPLRHWIDACSRIVVSSVLMLSTVFTFYPLAVGAFSDRSFQPALYPCEHVGSYYRDVEGLRGTALMRKLYSIVSPHRSLRYNAVWDALKILDAAEIDNPETSLDIVEIYSLRTVSKSLAGKPNGWNREHLWPRSYGLTDRASLTDLHNIHPADVNVNSARGNKYYGECLNVEAHCMRPANSEAAIETETDRERWAPPYQVRGDVARAIMYMAISYGFHQSDDEPNLQLSDTPSIRKSEMGLLSTLLKWNELDPPSRAEQLRNDRICRLYQHNRNPFIDHPEYANLIWKSHLAANNPSTTATTPLQMPGLPKSVTQWSQRP